MQTKSETEAAIRQFEVIRGKIQIERVRDDRKNVPCIEPLSQIRIDAKFPVRFAPLLRPAAAFLIWPHPPAFRSLRLRFAELRCVSARYTPPPPKFAVCVAAPLRSLRVASAHPCVTRYVRPRSLPLATLSYGSHDQRRNW